MTLDLRITAENASGQLTETDPNNRLAASSATTLDITALARNEVASRCYDGGSAGIYTGRAYAEGEIYINSSGASGYLCLGFSSRDSSASLATVSGEALALFFGVNPALADINFYDVFYESGIDHSGAGVSSGTRPPRATRFYYRIGFLSSLGRYGALFFEFYSDSGRTTLLRNYLTQRQAAGAYQYYHVAQSYSSGSAINVTGDTANVTIYQPAAGIDLTVATGGFTQTADPSSHITDYADCIVCTTLNTNEDEYHYKDYGASYFNGNYILTGVLNVTAFASGSGTMLTLLSLMNAITDGNGTEDKHCVTLDYVSASSYTLKLREVSSATGYTSSASSALNTSQPYWLKEWRDTSVGTYGTLYLSIYNDPAMQSLVETLSLALHDNGTPDVVAFQYFYPLQSWNTGSSRTTTFTIGGVSVDGGSVVSSDGVSTAEVAIASKASAALSSDGAATATLVAQNGDISATSISSAGASTAEAVPSSKASAAASSDGVATVIADTNSSTIDVLSDGVGTADAVPSSLASAAASSDGVATADAISAFSLVPGIVISCGITKDDSTGEIGATGLTPYLKFYSPLERQSMDFGDPDLTFKNNGDCISISTTMSPRDETNYPGVYDYSIDPTGLAVGVPTTYQYFINATISATEKYVGWGTVVILDGVEVVPGLTVSEHTLLARVSAALTNKHILDPSDGSIKVYDDNGALLYSGLAYTNAAGTALYNGKAAVHHTSRLA